ncbi:hypothetical protein Bca52824_081083 [Brassica carinata]|uniref:Phospholipase D n=1 Tax=Brassica carinata TaxID=52824 RepID=A0A8X7PHS2_BRACI|nr:hypothetical protein Bca52824_081083 [Brassica carinata]
MVQNAQGEPFQGIKNASFPQRSNCRVVLYQDAHHKATFDPRVHDVPCNARNLWEDVYKAIDCARHLVYIAGWALNPNLVLIVSKIAQEAPYGFRTPPKDHHSGHTCNEYKHKEREIMSFLGGFDLCDGRYDTEEHSLFRTLGTSDDFYQTSLAGAKLSRGGPREPWHDCHVCGIRNLVNSATTEEDDRNWNVQVLRSIDHVSATEMPRGLQVERSVHDGYVAAIRKAERFIYIENQYFMGGCEHWEEERKRMHKLDTR